MPTAVKTKKIMDELCPLCLKIGLNRRIKAVQINLEEAVWLCENEECPWPFGYDEMNIFTRRVGDKWAFEWQTYKQVQRCVGPIPLSTELSLYTPPVTPSNEAVTKDTAKTEITGGTNISELSNNIDNESDCQINFSNNLLTFDTYNSKSNWESNNEAHEKADKLSAKNVPLQSAVLSNPSVKKKSIVTSIFDIDNDDLVMEKIKPLCSDLKLTNSTARRSSVSVPLNAKNFEKTTESVSDRVDTVLIDSDSVIKVPQVRSIATANINLKGFDILNTAVVSNNNKEILEKATFSSKTPGHNEPVSPLKHKTTQESDDKLLSPRHHTTTINVNGILPITLSYDMADLVDDTAPVTSTPIQQRCRRTASTMQCDDHDTIPQVSIELPKKLAKLSSQRRAVKSKRYEKFSFNALKKGVRDSADINDVKLKDNKNRQEDITSNLCSRIDNNSAINSNINPNERTAITDSVEPLGVGSESVTLLNANENNSVVNAAQSLPVENVSLNCLLDDILLEGYQNATQNLNDDWLESFFT